MMILNNVDLLDYSALITPVIEPRATSMLTESRAMRPANRSDAFSTTSIGSVMMIGLRVAQAAGIEAGRAPAIPLHTDVDEPARCEQHGQKDDDTDRKRDRLAGSSPTRLHLRRIA